MSPLSTRTVSAGSLYLFNSGAAVKIALEKFEDAINDCDRAIEINQTFPKV